jgi:hypothetical protein
MNLAVQSIPCASFPQSVGAASDGTAGQGFLSANFADAVNLKSVPGREVVILTPNFFFQMADFLGKKFD